jgi:Cysteine-rich secretory protein family
VESSGTAATATSAISPIPDGWLATLNYFRSQAALPPVEGREGLSDAARKHARYMVKNQRFTHYEEPGLPFYSYEGHIAGQNSNLVASRDFRLSPSEGVTSWINQPFHALGMLEPSLRRSGYGSYNENNGPAKYDFGAALDVDSGLGTVPPSVDYPIMYPKPGATTYIQAYLGNEVPNPLLGCGFDNGVTGAPIYLIQKNNARLLSHSLTVNGGAVKHCAYDYREYPGDAGKASLKFHHGIVLIPRRPLASEAEYEVSITTEARTTSWEFTTADFTPPSSAITHPADEEEGKPLEGYDPDEIVTLTGTASDDATKVEIALLKFFQNGDCRWWDGDEFVARGCRNYLWVEAQGAQTWSYTLSEQLTGHNGVYYLYSHATDANGLKEFPRADDDSQVVFYVY